ncbi:hypothetical protein U9M48_022814 [Paspalum notatum var. saurae]|uniref:Uncharacterized protein n=1 Tax=Paspalum notatum var. saurae TaxID=547442 RepID=A0AAQ3TIG5_PASNO
MASRRDPVHPASSSVTLALGLWADPSPRRSPASGEQDNDDLGICLEKGKEKKKKTRGWKTTLSGVHRKRGEERGEEAWSWGAARMACSTSLCLSASIRPPPPAFCYSGSSRFLTIERVSSAPSLLRWTIQYKQSGHTLYRRSKALASASADSPKVKRSSGDSVVMVDPLEAKRLAAKQMQEIRAKEKLKKRRRAEAINGALAMIGLTAGLLVEAQTGKGILGQLAEYLTAISSLFGQ